MTPATAARHARQAIVNAGGIALQQDLATVLGLSVQRVHELTLTPSFPEPIARTHVAGRPVWAINEVVAWDAQRRPRRAPITCIDGR